MLGLVRCSFSSGLDTQAKKNLYITLVRSQLSYGWRPHLVKDFVMLETIQRRATKFILNDYHSDYKQRLLTLKLLPHVMQLELIDIMFFIRCLKTPADTITSFLLHSYVHFSSANTRSTTYLKLKHSLSKTNIIRHFHFNRLPRLWNSLPPINLDHPMPIIRRTLHGLLWSHLGSYFLSSDPCSFHYCCLCATCVCSSININYT